MIYFLLPSSNIYTYKNINCIFSSEKSVPVISVSLSKYLYEIKENINVYNKEWDTYKKYTNPYEYIHTTIPNKKKCVAKHKPLSRSYFKMIVILQMNKIYKTLIIIHLLIFIGVLFQPVKNVIRIVIHKVILYIQIISSHFIWRKVQAVL